MTPKAWAPAKWGRSFEPTGYSFFAFATVSPLRRPGSVTHGPVIVHESSMKGHFAVGAGTAPVTTDDD